METGRFKLRDIIYRRYCNPIVVFDSFSNFDDVALMILEVINATNEEQVWETWLHKDVEQSYKDFKKNVMKSSSSRKMTDEEAKKNIENAQNILKIKVKNPNGDGDEN